MLRWTEGIKSIKKYLLLISCSRIWFFDFCYHIITKLWHSEMCPFHGVFLKWLFNARYQLYYLCSQCCGVKSLLMFLTDDDVCQSPYLCHSNNTCRTTAESYTCECPPGNYSISSQNIVDPVCLPGEFCLYNISVVIVSIPARFFYFHFCLHWIVNTLGIKYFFLTF